MTQEEWLNKYVSIVLGRHFREVYGEQTRMGERAFVRWLESTLTAAYHEAQPQTVPANGKPQQAKGHQ